MLAFTTRKNTAQNGTRWLWFPPSLTSLGAKKFNKKEKTDSIMMASDCKILALIVLLVGIYTTFSIVILFYHKSLQFLNRVCDFSPPRLASSELHTGGRIFV